MLKEQYVTPKTLSYKIGLERTILSGVEKMTTVDGSWEEEDEMMTP